MLRPESIDPLDIRSIERAAKAANERAEQDSQHAIEDLRYVMQDKRGRRVIARILEMTGVDRSSFHTSGSVMAFNEGQRNVGLKLLSQVLASSPDGYSQMMQELSTK